MANLSSIARPYALAAFEYARDKKQLPAWMEFLKSAAVAAHQPDVLRLLSYPEFPTAKILDVFYEALAAELDTEKKNFLQILGQNKRLAALPEISELFSIYYAALEKISTVRMVTAIDVDQDFQKRFAAALAKRVQREVTLRCEVDPAIIGGAVIHIGDRVIDGSIRGKLSRLLESLTS